MPIQCSPQRALGLWSTVKVLILVIKAIRIIWLMNSFCMYNSIESIHVLLEGMCAIILNSLRPGENTAIGIIFVQTKSSIFPGGLYLIILGFTHGRILSSPPAPSCLSPVASLSDCRGQSEWRAAD